MTDPTVVLAADTNFCKQLAVTIASLSRTTCGRLHSVFVLHDGYTSSLRARIEASACPDLEVRWLEVNAAAVDAALLPPSLPSATLFRLLVDSMLPASIDKIIYLDTDTVVRHSLAPLWETPLDSHIVGAVRDSWLWWFAQGLPWREMGLPPDVPYFNAGVLVASLEAWRAADVSTRALDLVSRYRFEDAEQGALNVIIKGDWLPLDPRWNLQGTHLTGDAAGIRALEPPGELDAAIADPAVVHFCKSLWARPWEAESQHPLRREWFEVLDTTSWCGWRPTEPTWRSLVRRRARRTKEMLLHGHSPSVRR
jgi:lipopolysaccharide biosynthesis glycosyltransferase